MGRDVQFGRTFDYDFERDDSMKDDKKTYDELNKSLNEQ